MRCEFISVVPEGHLFRLTCGRCGRSRLSHREFVAVPCKGGKRLLPSPGPLGPVSALAAMAGEMELAEEAPVPAEAPSLASFGFETPTLLASAGCLCEDGAEGSNSNQFSVNLGAIRCRFKTIRIVNHPKGTYRHVCRICGIVRYSNTKVYVRECDKPEKTKCKNLGKATRTAPCKSCSGTVRLKVFTCSEFGECCKGPKTVEGLQTCVKCPKHTGLNRTANKPN